MKKEGEMKFFIITLVVVIFAASIKAATIEQLDSVLDANVKEKECILQNLKDSINIFFQALPNDNIISGREMENLRVKVQGFDQEKAQINKELFPYRRVIWTELSPVYRTNAGNIKKYFMEKTGRNNIRIETVSKLSSKDLIFPILWGSAAIFMLLGFF
ncbi:MAG: hypothetical protein PHG83_02035 [Patescibacteria group bacterium]|nr:hypothetical protein [Patescibacteria group bacterium]